MAKTATLQLLPDVNVNSNNSKHSLPDALCHNTKIIFKPLPPTIFFLAVTQTYTKLHSDVQMLCYIETFELNITITVE